LARPSSSLFFLPDASSILGCRRQPKTLAAAAAAAAAADLGEMGGKCPHRKVKKRRLSHKTARRGKFLLKADDAVYEELVKLADHGKDAESKELPIDEDLPGMGQFYCLHCEYAFPPSTDLDESSFLVV
jgi:bud site selection protein 20